MSQASRMNPSPQGTTLNATPRPAFTSYTKTEWEHGLASVKVTKDDLNSLILNYLLIEGHASAARAFCAETGLTPSIDYDEIGERMGIREAVEGGRVEEALRRVNELDPEILDMNPTLLFHLHLQLFIELIRQSQIPRALSFAATELAPQGAQNPEFLKDLERTMALLAFPELAEIDHLASGAGAGGRGSSRTTTTVDGGATGETKPEPAWATLGNMMRKEHRIKVAKELNAAILESQGQGKETRLGGLVKLMSWGENQLQTRGVRVPSLDVSTLLTLETPQPRDAGLPLRESADEPMQIA